MDEPFGDIRDWGRAERLAKLPRPAPERPPHAHYVCRVCFAQVCDDGVGQITPMLCLSCAACSWRLRPAESCRAQAVWVNAQRWQAVLRARRKRKEA